MLQVHSFFYTWKSSWQRRASLLQKRMECKAESISSTHLTLMSALYFLPLTMPRRVGAWLSLKLRVTSYTAVTVERQTKTVRTKKICAFWTQWTFVGCLCVPPVPLRHCSVVVNPLVLGSRWYLSLGRPLLSATCILIWCFCSVKRVPSQYSRNCGDKSCVNTYTPTVYKVKSAWGDLVSLVPSTTLLLLGWITDQVHLDVTLCQNKVTILSWWY